MAVSETTIVKTDARDSALQRHRQRSAWQFLLPMLVVLLLVAGWPLLRTIWFGFTDARLSDLGGFSWVGFENYLTYRDGRWSGLLADPLWWRAVRNTLMFTVISVGLETVLGTRDALAFVDRLGGLCKSDGGLCPHRLTGIIVAIL